MPRLDNRLALPVVFALASVVMLHADVSFDQVSTGTSV